MITPLDSKRGPGPIRPTEFNLIVVDAIKVEIVKPEMNRKNADDHHLETKIIVTTSNGSHATIILKTKAPDAPILFTLPPEIAPSYEQVLAHMEKKRPKHAFDEFLKGARDSASTDDSV